MSPTSLAKHQPMVPQQLLPQPEMHEVAEEAVVPEATSEKPMAHRQLPPQETLALNGMKMSVRSRW
jgi:hypothetical protein